MQKLYTIESTYGVWKTIDKEGKIPHCEDGPAFIGNVNCHIIKSFWSNGKLHRLNGPARIYRSNMIGHYYINGTIYYNLNEYKRDVFLYSKIAPNFLGDAIKIISI